MDFTDFISLIALMPLGFFGMLGGLGGGLLGGGKRGGGGLLGGLLNNDNKSSGGKKSSIKTYNAQAPQGSQSAPEEAEQEGQTAAETQAPPPPQQPKQQTMVDDMAEPIQRAQPVLQQRATEQAKKTPLGSLLDDPLPAREQSAPEPGLPAPPTDVVNQTDTSTPVAQPVDEMFGQTPQLEQSELVGNQMMQAGSNRQPFAYQEGLPDRQVSTDSEWAPDMGYAYKQTSSVGGMPTRKYR